jgi:2-iminobutanoate/2-iminopropanoate deaminase
MRKVVHAAGAAAVGPYSHAVYAGELLILSGQTPIDSATGHLIAGSVGRQTEQCLSNLAAVLAPAGLTFDDVVSVQVFLIDMNDFKEMNAAYATHFNQPYPARTTIGCASLPLGARVEIALIAKVRSGSS